MLVAAVDCGKERRLQDDSPITMQKLQAHVHRADPCCATSIMVLAGTSKKGHEDHFELLSKLKRLPGNRQPCACMLSILITSGARRAQQPNMI